MLARLQMDDAASSPRNWSCNDCEGPDGDDIRAARNCEGKDGERLFTLSGNDFFFKVCPVRFFARIPAAFTLWNFAAHFMESHVLPYAGGTQDQPAPVWEAMQIIVNECGRIVKERTPKPEGTT